MKIHDFQAKWPMLQLVWKDSFPKWSHILHMCVYYTSQKVCQRKFLFSLHEKSFSIFWVTKMGFFVKDLPNIWCQLETLYFCKILDHVLFTIDQSFHVIWFLYTSSEKDKFPQIQLERGQIWTTCAW